MFIAMFDEFGASRTIQINLTWSGGELSTDKNKYVTTSPYTRTMVKSTASIRNSTSITGALVLDGLKRGKHEVTLGYAIPGPAPHRLSVLYKRLRLQAVTGDGQRSWGPFTGWRALTGLGPQEGPFPQWNLPVVR